MGFLKEASTDTDGNTTLKVVVGGNRYAKLKLKHPGWKQPTYAMETNVLGGWTASMDFKSKDILLERKLGTRLGDLTIKQRIPKKQLFLVPSPVLQLDTSLLKKGSLRDDLKLGHDFLSRTTYASEELSWKGGKLKAGVAVDSATGLKGAKLSLSTKLNRPWATSAGLTLSHSAGPALKHEVNLADGVVNAKTEYKLKSKTVRVELAPRKYNNIRTTLTTTVKTDKPTKPTFSLSAKLEL